MIGPEAIGRGAEGERPLSTRGEGEFVGIPPAIIRGVEGRGVTDSAGRLFTQGGGSERG